MEYRSCSPVFDVIVDDESRSLPRQWCTFTMPFHVNRVEIERQQDVLYRASNVVCS